MWNVCVCVCVRACVRVTVQVGSIRERKHITLTSRFDSASFLPFLFECDVDRQGCDCYECARVSVPCVWQVLDDNIEVCVFYVLVIIVCDDSLLLCPPKSCSSSS